MVKKKDDHEITITTRGQSLVEFALVLPFLLLLVVGAIEFGRLFFMQIALTNAAREGAYYRSLYPEDETNANAAVIAEALNSGIPLKENGEPDIQITYENCCTPGDYVRVNVKTGMPNLFITGFILNAFSLNELSASVEVMVLP